MTDHSIYMAENYTDYVRIPGFPYLRLHPALIFADYPTQPSASTEQVLLVMHSTSENLLVISNKNVFVYKIPRHKSFAERVGGAGVKTALSFIPVVGETMEVVDKLGEGRERLQAYGEILGGLTGKAKREREEDLQRAAEGMPTKKELENLVWNMKDENILAMILCYRDRILIENGFDWKVSFKQPLERTADVQNTVTVDKYGIMLHVNRRSSYVPFPRNKFDYLAMTVALIRMNQEELAAAGWSVESDGKKIIFKNG